MNNKKIALIAGAALVAFAGAAQANHHNTTTKMKNGWTVAEGKKEKKAKGKKSGCGGKCGGEKKDKGAEGDHKEHKDGAAPAEGGATQ